MNWDETQDILINLENFEGRANNKNDNNPIKRVIYTEINTQQAYMGM